MFEKYKNFMVAIWSKVTHILSVFVLLTKKIIFDQIGLMGEM